MSGDPVYISEGTTFQLNAWDNSHKHFFEKGAKCDASGYYYLIEESSENESGYVDFDPPLNQAPQAGCEFMSRLPGGRWNKWPPDVKVRQLDLKDFKFRVPRSQAIKPVENPKDAIGRLKPNLHLVPSGGLIPLARVMELGADKYGPFNWRDTPIKGSVYVSAAMRHIVQWMDGADQDAESGQSHLAHAAACMMIALDALACGTLVDDRPTPGRAGELCNVNE